MPSFVADRVAYSQNSHMVQSAGAKNLNTTVNSNGVALQNPRLVSNPEVVNHSLKIYAYDDSITETDGAILWFAQSAGMKLLQYGEALFANPFALEKCTTTAPLTKYSWKGWRNPLATVPATTGPHTLLPTSLTLISERSLSWTYRMTRVKRLRRQPALIRRSNKYIVHGRKTNWKLSTKTRHRPISV